MKIILLKDVAKIGKKYELKNVSDGYALNFLFPKNLAEIASDKSMSKLEERQKQEEEVRRVREDVLIKNLKSLSGMKIEIKEKANEKGHLFAGIHKSELVKAIKKQANIDIDEDHLDLPEPIKTAGEHEIKIKIQDKEATFKLTVV